MRDNFFLHFTKFPEAKFLVDKKKKSCSIIVDFEKFVADLKIERRKILWI